MARRTDKTLQKVDRRPTMADVAKSAGVSQATVSLVMNGVGDVRISASTRLRVLAAADELGYRIGRRVVSGSSLRSIIMLLDEVSTNPLAAADILGAREVAWQNECILTVITTRGDPAIEEAALDLLLAQPTAGVIYAATATRQVNPPERLRAIPTVLLNCRTADGRMPAVLPGHADGASTATEALLEAGHRRIAFINGEAYMLAARERLRGYREALAAWNVPFDATLVRPGNWLLSDAYDQTRALMALDQPPTAIFCASDRMALGAYEALREIGLRIPEDVSVVGYDDDSFARYLPPPLTTVLVPHEEMGRWAVEHLLSLTEASAPGKKHRPVTLECPLVERNSIGTIQV